VVHGDGQHMHMVNDILKKSVVTREQDCLKSAVDRAAVSCGKRMCRNPAVCAEERSIATTEQFRMAACGYGLAGASQNNCLSISYPAMPVDMSKFSKRRLTTWPKLIP
jgi:hypothetical protein